MVGESRDTLTAALAAFYVAVRSDPNDGDSFRPVVVSPTKNQARKITAVSVGDLFDVMQSRRKSLREVRATGVVDAS